MGRIDWYPIRFRARVDCSRGWCTAELTSTCRGTAFAIHWGDAGTNHERRFAYGTRKSFKAAKAEAERLITEQIAKAVTP